MKAWGVVRYRSELQLVDVAEPEFGPTDLLVKVKSVGLNHLDEMVRNGEFKAVLPVSLPFIIGHELSGEVVAVGASVTKFKVGDKVFSRPSTMKSGVLTSQVVLDPDEVALMPETCSFDEAAALPLATLTAWQVLVERGKVGPGQKVLIHGGAGAVGSVSIQLAKHLGAIVATTVSPKNSEFVRALGADTIIDYTQQDFTDVVSDYDLVLDTVGGTNVLRSLTVLKRGGLAIGISGPADAQFARAVGANKVVSFVVKLGSTKVMRLARQLGVKYEFLFMRPSGAQLGEISRLVDSGVVSLAVGRRYTFETADLGLKDLISGSVARGKAIVALE